MTTEDAGYGRDQVSQPSDKVQEGGYDRNQANQPTDVVQDSGYSKNEAKEPTNQNTNQNGFQNNSNQNTDEEKPKDEYKHFLLDEGVKKEFLQARFQEQQDIQDLTDLKAMDSWLNTIFDVCEQVQPNKTSNVKISFLAWQSQFGSTAWSIQSGVRTRSTVSEIPDFSANYIAQKFQQRPPLINSEALNYWKVENDLVFLKNLNNTHITHAILFSANHTVGIVGITQFQKMTDCLEVAKMLQATCVTQKPAKRMPKSDFQLSCFIDYDFDDQDIFIFKYRRFQKSKLNQTTWPNADQPVIFVFLDMLNPLSYELLFQVYTFQSSYINIQPVVCLSNVTNEFDEHMITQQLPYLDKMNVVYCIDSDPDQYRKMYQEFLGIYCVRYFNQLFELQTVDLLEECIAVFGKPNCGNIPDEQLSYEEHEDVNFMLVSGVRCQCFNRAALARMDDATQFVIAYLDPSSEELVYAVKRLVDLQMRSAQVFAAVCFAGANEMDYYKLKTKFPLLEVIAVFSDAVGAASYYRQGKSVMCYFFDKAQGTLANGNVEEMIENCGQDPNEEVDQSTLSEEQQEIYKQVERARQFKISSEHKEFVRMFNIKYTFGNTENFTDNFHSQPQHVVIVMDPIAPDFQQKLYEFWQLQDKVNDQFMYCFTRKVEDLEQFFALSYKEKMILLSGQPEASVLLRRSISNQTFYVFQGGFVQLHGNLPSQLFDFFAQKIEKQKQVEPDVVLLQERELKQMTFSEDIDWKQPNKLVYEGRTYQIKIGLKDYQNKSEKLNYILEQSFNPEKQKQFVVGFYKFDPKDLYQQDLRKTIDEIYELVYEQYAETSQEDRDGILVKIIQPRVYFVLCLCGISQVKRPIPQSFDEQVKVSTRINKDLDVLELVQTAIPEILVLNVALDNMTVIDKTTYLVYETDEANENNYKQKNVYHSIPEVYLRIHDRLDGQDLPMRHPIHKPLFENAQ